MERLIRPIYLLLFASVSVLPHAWDIHWNYILASMLLLVWGCASHYFVKLSPPKFFLWLLALAAPLVVLLHFRTLLGPESSTSLLLILIGIKFFEVKTRRDLIIFLFLILLVGIYRLIFSQDLIALFTMGTIFGVFIGGLLQIRSRRKLSWQEVMKVFRRKEVYIAVPLVITFFVFFPRFTTPFGRLVEEERSIVGFSENLNPGDLAQLAVSEEVAFRVNFREGFRPQWDQLYFRGITLSQTDGFNWSRVRLGSTLKVNASLESVDYFLSQTPRFGKVVFSLDRTSVLELEGRRDNVISLDDGTFRLTRDLRQGFVSGGQVGSIPEMPATKESLFLQLPEDFKNRNPMSWALLQSLTESKPFADHLAALRSFFSRSRFVYTLSTPQYLSLDAFLFGAKEGFCEHYASALALLLRGLGYPSRVVTGFQGGEYNDFGQYLLVRDKYAHAWVETFVDDGWIRIDPTAWVNSNRIASSAGVLAQQGSWWQAGQLQRLYYFLDGLNNRFHMFFLTFDRNQQIDFLRELGWDSASLKSLVLVLCGLCLLISAVGYIWFRRRTAKLSKAEKLRRVIEKELRKLQLTWPRTLGPLELQAKLEKHKDGKAWTSQNNTLLQEYIRTKYQRPGKRKGRSSPAFCISK